MEVAGMSDVAVSVRLLGRDDVAPMRSMLAMFGEASDEGRAYSARPPGAAWLQRLLGSDAFIAIAAMQDDEMVGGNAAYVLQSDKRRVGHEWGSQIRRTWVLVH